MSDDEFRILARAIRDGVYSTGMSGLRMFGQARTLLARGLLVSRASCLLTITERGRHAAMSHRRWESFLRRFP